MTRSLGIMVAAALLLCGCSRPMDFEKFVKSSDAVADNYDFEISVLDTLSTYDLSFYTRIDRPVFRRQEASMKLIVKWISPSGAVGGEVVYMDVSKAAEAYRSGVSFRQTGNWILSVKVADPPEGLRGLGLAYTENGTR